MECFLVSRVADSPRLSGVSPRPNPLGLQTVGSSDGTHLPSLHSPRPAGGPEPPWEVGWCVFSMQIFKPMQPPLPLVNFLVL